MEPTTSRSDDEREARAIRGLDYWAQYATNPAVRVDCAFARDLIRDLAARKHPEPEITDQMIRAAREVLDDPHDDWSAEGYWDRMARAVLEAALRVPVGEGEQ